MPALRALTASLALLLALAALPRGAAPALGGSPRYPDLVALPPDDLYLSREVLADGAEHLLLRFATTAWNAGDGPLELAGDAGRGGGEVHQVLYDAAVGGEAVARRPLGADLSYHASHHHFHLAGFAAYALLRVGPLGLRMPTGLGGKQSSCVLDGTRVADGGPPGEEYRACEEARQGLSVGWGDTYAAALPDQWVDLGPGPLADGDYELRYAVDPADRIAEGGREANNVASTRFAVSGGRIVGRPEPPRCALTGATSGPPGAEVALECAHFPAGAEVGVYWGGWDPWDAGAEPAATFTGTGPTPTTVAFAVPAAQPGGYTVAVVAYDRGVARYVGTAVVVGVEPAGPGPGTPAAARHREHHRAGGDRTDQASARRPAARGRRRPMAPPSSL